MIFEKRPQCSRRREIIDGNRDKFKAVLSFGDDEARRCCTGCFAEKRLPNGGGSTAAGESRAGATIAIIGLSVRGGAALWINQDAGVSFPRG
jgi:hypothetical protein